jgi:hypothetical protein
MRPAPAVTGNGPHGVDLGRIDPLATPETPARQFLAAKSIADALGLIASREGGR